MKYLLILILLITSFLNIYSSSKEFSQNAFLPENSFEYGIHLGVGAGSVGFAPTVAINGYYELNTRLNLGLELWHSSSLKFDKTSISETTYKFYDWSIGPSLRINMLNRKKTPYIQSGFAYNIRYAKTSENKKELRKQYLAARLKVGFPIYYNSTFSLRYVFGSNIGYNFTKDDYNTSLYTGIHLNWRI